MQTETEITPEDIENVLPVLFNFYYANQANQEAPNLSWDPDKKDRFVKAGITCIIEQLSKLNIPRIEGLLRGGSLVFLRNPDFESHKSLYGEGAVCVLEKDTTWHDNRLMLDGFSAKVRLSSCSDTWLCVGICSSEQIESDDDDYDDDIDNEEDHQEITQEEKERIAVIVANSHGFRELKNREQRMAFAIPIIDKESAGKEWNTYFRPEHEIAQMSAELHDLGITPMRAKELASEGKSAAEIGKLLGISKQKAERAINAEIPQYITDQLNRKYGDE